MDTYYVSYRTPSGIKQKIRITAFSLIDAKTVVKNAIRVDNNDLFDCTLLRIWKQIESTPKQKLAQKYGFIIGSIKGAKKQFNNTIFTSVTDPVIVNKLSRAYGLADSQFAKLERDIRDCFKLAGLKVK